ncbi:MAG: xanthine dehydrogenase family protein molybdopterin-binding subunit [Gemmatimonadaceae bacterium]|nr:xanthine dehydrogenase family protein molybdopterin-binding subunit [Gemmatimonadaceae bacterium]
MSARRSLPWVSFAASDAKATVPRDAASDEACDGPIDTGRRDLVKLLGAGGLLFVTGPFGIRRLEAAERLVSGAAAAEPWEAHAYITLGEDGIVTLVCHRSEMGQGIRTTMPMILADEMEADWTNCRVVQAVGDEPRYGSQNTDGSTSIRDFLSKYREAGSTVRALLEDAAAKEWGVSASEVKAKNGEVVHLASGRSKSFGALVATARALPMPARERVRIKTKAERRWEGKGITSIDLKPMTTGTAMYAADVVLPGMKVAAIARPAVWGGKVVSVDDSAALKVPGVEKVIRLPDGPMPGAFLPLGGVAVVATNTWAAIKGRDALVVTWDDGPNKGYDSVSYKAALLESVRTPGRAGRTNGDAAAALASASRKVSAEYYVPHLSHAQMEPVAAIARVDGGKVDAWGCTQSPMDTRKTLAEFLKVDVANVTVHVTLLGGGFGRKSKPDYVCEAAWLAREVGAPVRVQWTREDDLRHSYYHSVAAHRLEAALDASGKVTAWLHRSAYPAISATFAPNVPGPEPDELTNGASDIPFDIPNISVEACPAVAMARIGWFRSVNAIHHGFAIGSFVDELARAARQDTGDFLLQLMGSDRQVDLSKAGLVAPASNYGATWGDHPLDTARAKRVVQIVMDKSGWKGAKLPRGRGRGIAIHRSFLSYVAMVVEVEVLPDGTVLVPRATVAVDAGFVANPDRARAQMEGALIMAMSNTLYSEVSFAQGKVVQSNFRDYQVTRMRAAPRVVDVTIVESEGLPGGIGEPGVPPAGGAIANAIFAATGVRVRDLPVAKQLAGWPSRAATEEE